MSIAAELAAFLVHTSTVETHLGTSGAGARLYATGQDKACYVERKRQYVRSATGEQVISSTQVFADPAFASIYVPESRVTVDGVPSTVITTAVFTSGDLDLPDHMIAYLQ